MAGLEIDETHPGYKRFIVQPHPGGGLTWARTDFISVYGKISVGWNLENKGTETAVTVKIHVPVNTQAVIRLYGCRKILKNDGIDFEAVHGVIEGVTGSGDYEIVYMMED